MATYVSPDAALTDALSRMMSDEALRHRLASAAPEVSGSRSGCAAGARARAAPEMPVGKPR